MSAFFFSSASTERFWKVQKQWPGIWPDYFSLITVFFIQLKRIDPSAEQYPRSIRISWNSQLNHSASKFGNSRLGFFCGEWSQRPYYFSSPWISSNSQHHPWLLLLSTSVPNEIACEIFLLICQPIILKRNQALYKTCMPPIKACAVCIWMLGYLDHYLNKFHLRTSQ